MVGGKGQTWSELKREWIGGQACVDLSCEKLGYGKKMEKGCLDRDSVMREDWVGCRRGCGAMSFIPLRYSSSAYIWPGPLLGRS